MRPVVITGFMGCGKTSVARELAVRLNTSMVDLDERITALTSRTPAQLIVEEGEAAFRTVESDTLRNLLQMHEAEVIALGGGAWIRETNRDLVREYGCLSVWLDASFELCWSRIEASGDDRPLGKTREQAESLYYRRRPVYELSDLHIQVVPEQTFDDLLSQIVNRIRVVCG